MIAHFELVQGKSRFLVFRLGEDFHIIDCNEALTKEKRFTVLESGCTPKRRGNLLVECAIFDCLSGDCHALAGSQ